MSYQQGLDDDVDIEEGRSPSPPDYHNARSLSPPVYSDAINDVLLLKGVNMYLYACVHDVCLMYIVQWLLFETLLSIACLYTVYRLPLPDLFRSGVDRTSVSLPAYNSPSHPDDHPSEVSDRDLQSQSQVLDHFRQDSPLVDSDRLKDSSAEHSSLLVH